MRKRVKLRELEKNAEQEQENVKMYLEPRAAIARA